ncbi:hypothetical protein [Anaerosporobacter mobilis]|jgi:hypothetical protein|uniref:hypothetical protein n=1 Tax=Anaerosporobacter mobilis TaxID=264463 RepID=UPI000933516E|nr:hypothetical protein [Anaerosporobacter mobilis]
MTISVLTVFTAGFTKGMKNPICFVVGTIILTAMGLKAFETIQAGEQNSLKNFLNVQVHLD